MKLLLPTLALFATLYPFAGVRADEKSDFMESLAVPLSRTEAAQLEGLIKAKQSAEADYNDNPQKSVPWIQAGQALERFKTEKRWRLPLEVQLQRPKDAATLYAGRFPMGIGDKPMLVHLWTAGPNAPKGANSMFERAPFKTSPLHLDVFGLRSGKTERWRLITQTTYNGESYPNPDEVKLRWLRPAAKRSPVLVLVSPVYMATLYTVLTYPNGITDKNSPSYVQEFSQGGVGGGKILYDFGVDARGLMTVVNTTSYLGRIEKQTVLAWNGRQYAPTTPKQFKQN